MRLCVCGHSEDSHDAHLIADPSVDGLCSWWHCGCTEFRVTTYDEEGRALAARLGRPVVALEDGSWAVDA